MVAQKLIFLIALSIFNSALLFLCCKNILPVLFVISFAFLLLYLTLKNKMLIFIFLAFLTSALSLLLLHNKSKLLSCYTSGEYINAKAKIISLEHREFYDLAKLQLYDKCRTVALAKLYKQNLSVSDIVFLRATVKEIENFSETFDYKNFLKSKGISILLDIKEMHKKEAGKDLNSFLFAIKEKYRNTIYNYMPAREASLALGITVGEKNALSKSDKQAFIDSSLIHIVVFSGFNMMVFAFAVYFLLFFLPLYLRVLFSIASIFLFAAMIGFDAPTTRASIMAALSFLAVALGKESEAMHLLFISFIIMFVLNPLSLLYDPGFQMSFAITLSLILFANRLIELLSFSSKFFTELFASSLVAGFAAMPFTLFYMGQASTVGLFANMLVLPVVPSVMLVTFLIFLFSFFAHPIALFFALLDIFLLKFIFFIAKSTSSFKYALAKFYINEIALVFFVYLLFFFAYKKISHKGEI